MPNHPNIHDAPFHPSFSAALCCAIRYALLPTDTDVFVCLDGLRVLELRQSRADPFMFHPKLSLAWLPHKLERLELRQIEVGSGRRAAG